MDPNITEISDANAVIGNLARECEAFTATGLEELALGPAAARAVVSMSHHIVIRLAPMRAMLVVEAANGDLRTAYRADGTNVPSALGKACAQFVAVSVAQLTPRARATLLQLQNAGAALSVTVCRDEGVAAILLELGNGEREIVVKVDTRPTGTLH